MHPLISEALSFDLITYVKTPASLLGINAALAKQGAIYRLRAIDDKEFSKTIAKPLDFEDIDKFVDGVIRHVKDFVDLKALNSKLMQKGAIFGLTIVPDEPCLEVKTVEELEDMVTTYYGFDLCSSIDVTTAEEAVEEVSSVMPLTYLDEARNALTDARELSSQEIEHILDSYTALMFEINAACDQRKQELLKERSRVYCYYKKWKMKMKKKNGWMGKKLRAREEKKKEELAEKRAWDEGERVWRMSMLDQDWWVQKGYHGDHYPVWNYVRHDLAPEPETSRRYTIDVQRH